MKNVEQTTLWTAMVTPFNEDLSVDLQSFETLLRHQESAGNGVLILGSTGEGLALSYEEKKKVLAHTCSLKLTVPVMVGIGGFNQELTLKWLKFCESQPIDAYVMVTPLYAKPGAKGQIGWFKTLLDAASHPCMLYNVPSRTGCQLSIEAVATLANHPNFWAIKEASGSASQFENYHTAATNIALYSGEDSLLPTLMAEGAKGLVSVTANAWPKATKKYVSKCANRPSEELILLWRVASEAMFNASNPIPIKKLLYLNGWISTPLVRPPLACEDLKGDEELRRCNELVNEWFSPKPALAR